LGLDVDVVTQAGHHFSFRVRRKILAG